MPMLTIKSPAIKPYVSSSRWNRKPKATPNTGVRKVKTESFATG